LLSIVNRWRVTRTAAGRNGSIDGVRKSHRNVLEIIDLAPLSEPEFMWLSLVLFAFGKLKLKPARQRHADARRQ
jgi:hypothetical protein